MLTFESIVLDNNLNREFARKFVYLYYRDKKVTPDIIARTINISRFLKNWEYRKKYEKIEDLLMYYTDIRWSERLRQEWIL